MKSLRVAKQNELEVDDYHIALSMELDLVYEDWLMALENIWLNKLRVTWAYTKHVKRKEFKEWDFVWKTIQLISTKDLAFGKWSPN